MVDRARLLGWPAEQVTVIDDDQGKSAAGSAAAHDRDGFARLVSAVGLGRLGSCWRWRSPDSPATPRSGTACWMAGLAGVLIADDTTIYDPRLFNDRLLLACGAPSARSSCTAFRSVCAGRGAARPSAGSYACGRRRLRLRQRRAGRASILIRRSRGRCGHLRAVCSSGDRERRAPLLQRAWLTLPRRRWLAQTAPTIVWMRPSYQAIHMVLTNPTYAGAYVYGYRRQAPAVTGAVRAAPPLRPGRRRGAAA